MVVRTFEYKLRLAFFIFVLTKRSVVVWGYQSESVVKF